MSQSGKRHAVYKPSRNAALDEISRLKIEWRAHGTAAVTSEERSYISMARTELGDLSRLPEVLRHWRLTGPDAVIKTIAENAVAKYLEFRATLGIDRRTLRDSKSALHVFLRGRGWRNLHEITTAEVRAYLDEKAQGWSRRTAFKQLSLFFEWAKGEHLVAVDLMEQIKPPLVKATEVEVYRPDDFKALLYEADARYPELVPFLALSGFGMMRSGELVSQYADRPVLGWEHVIWDRGIIAVPEAVAKQTRKAADNRREPPICDALRHWLEPCRRESGKIVDMSEPQFRQQMAALFAKANVRRIDNGLRKSAISYFIAQNPEVGVTLAAKYAGNSEAIARRHYLAWISEEQGRAWFGIRR